jgi:arabinofuranosyltransferase
MTEDLPVESHPWLHNRLQVVCGLGMIGIAFLSTVAVYRSAWISDDSFITLRYVYNTLHGYGAVFNIGEYVQGYTHPLWYLLLLPGSYVFHNEILTTIFLGLFLTLFSLLVFGCILLKHANNPIHALLVFGLACAVFMSSDFWISFQTGGLEEPLSHLLILLVVSEAYYHKTERPARLLLWLSLLCLSRPDYAIFVLPFGILLLPKLRSLRTLGLAILAVLPLVVWLLFAWWYYGSPLPNTGTAKLDVYPNLLISAMLGVLYLGDWFSNDLLAAGITFAVVIFYAGRARGNRVTRVISIAMILYLLWVILIGGDFMHGRFFMGVFTSGVFFGSFELLRILSEGSYRLRWFHFLFAFLIFAGAFMLSMHNASGTDTEFNGFIANERQFYPGYSLRNYLREGNVTSPYLDLSFAADLRAYTHTCGPVTIHARNPGTMGYLVGPTVTIIDTLGLTDRYIAGLPKEYLLDPMPRPGHPDKYIPVQYLAARGDISLLPDWEKSVKQLDCSLTTRVKRLTTSTQFWSLHGMGDIDLRTR